MTTTSRPNLLSAKNFVGLLVRGRIRSGSTGVGDLLESKRLFVKVALP
jgi:hypothetical protein